MEATIAEIVGGATLLGLTVTSIGGVLALGRKVGQIERDVEGNMKEISSLRQGAVDRAVAVAKLEAKMDAMNEKLDRVLSTTEAIQRNCASIARTGSCPADPNHGGHR